MGKQTDIVLVLQQSKCSSCPAYVKKNVRDPENELFIGIAFNELQQWTR
jgi:hypothetical protein